MAPGGSVGRSVGRSGWVHAGGISGCGDLKRRSHGLRFKTAAASAICEMCTSTSSTHMRQTSRTTRGAMDTLHTPEQTHRNRKPGSSLELFCSGSDVGVQSGREVTRSGNEQVYATVGWTARLSSVGRLGWAAKPVDLAGFGRISGDCRWSRNRFWFGLLWALGWSAGMLCTGRLVG